ncbi:MarR family winged helix-turn-helix transcriptional regulator [Psychrilyobacter atlanticus]|uniref:MarR family winged helix-turn-helix transcriptional regulator n=1 Tax=Psychrilyobacter atlanticus TaxID=271091 RepID=UPI00048F5B87|nr:MarR family transcriptional regulator [Psychrilyobacter atlanticus]
MRYDNTINLISKIREISNMFIISELEKLGIKGIVPSHGDIIVTLIKHKELTMTEIAEKINKDRSTVTTLIKKLNKIGFTATKKNENDQRSNFVFLTSKGKELEEGFNQISERLYDIQFDGVTEEEKDIFRKILIKIYNNFKQENQN